MGNVWVIAGKPGNEIPAVGAVYEIRDSRKGIFTGRIIAVCGEWADVEVLNGKIHWASTENKLFNANPEVVSIRASLVYLIEREPANTASTGQERDSAHEPALSNSTHVPAQGA